MRTSGSAALSASPARAGAGEQGRPVERVGALGRQDGGDLGERVARGAGEARVGAALDPARAERQRLDLVEGEHQRRQREAGPQHVAEARLALDGRALRLQRGDVAIERAQRDAKLLRERRARDRRAAAAQRLHQFEQALGARHRLFRRLEALAPLRASPHGERALSA